MGSCPFAKVLPFLMSKVPVNIGKKKKVKNPLVSLTGADTRTVENEIENVLAPLGC